MTSCDARDAERDSVASAAGRHELSPPSHPSQQFTIKSYTNSSADAEIARQSNRWKQPPNCKTRYTFSIARWSSSVEFWITGCYRMQVAKISTYLLYVNFHYLLHYIVTIHQRYRRMCRDVGSCQSLLSCSTQLD